MSPVVLIPFTGAEPGLADAMTSVRRLGFDVATYTHPDVPSQDVLDAVEMYVLPYMGPSSDLALMSRMPALRVLQTLTAGTDHVWVHVPEGVTVHNAHGVHDASTAELAVALTLAKLRGLDDFARAQLTGQWLSSRRESLTNKRVLILGAGGVGRAIAARLWPFEVECVLAARAARPGAVAMDDALASLASFDVVILALPLNRETTGLVDEQFIKSMAPGALLVNVGRGPLVNTDALVTGLHAGLISAALDVTDPEPLPADHPLWSAPNVLISPHVGGNTSAFLPRALPLAADQIRRFASGLPLEFEVRRPQTP